MNYQESFEILDPRKFIEFLEDVKSVSSEIVIVPRVLNQITISNSITGLKAHTIYSLSLYEKFAQREIDSATAFRLWEDPSVEFIAFEYSSMAPFIRHMKNNNISYLQMQYKTFIVNGKRKSVATLITTNVEVKVSTPAGETMWIPNIPLLPPYELFNEINYHINLFNMGRQVAVLDPKDEEFVDIWNQPAAEGARLWIPRLQYYKKDIHPYIIYLSKTMFSIAKSDKVELEIRDSLKDQPGHFFMVRFRVFKTKKKISSSHFYYMTGILV